MPQDLPEMCAKHVRELCIKQDFPRSTCCAAIKSSAVHELIPAKKLLMADIYVSVPLPPSLTPSVSAKNPANMQVRSGC